MGSLNYDEREGQLGLKSSSCCGSKRSYLRMLDLDDSCSCTKKSKIQYSVSDSDSEWEASSIAKPPNSKGIGREDDDYEDFDEYKVAPKAAKKDSPLLTECANNTSPHHPPKSNPNSPKQQKQEAGLDLGPNWNWSQDHEVAPAQPLIRAAWMGNFVIYRNNRPDNFITGLKACVSSKACAQVGMVAEKLQRLIGWEMVPRWRVWPKSFKQCGPTQDNIGVFFFPSMAKDESEYQSLVLDMIGEDMALMTTVMGLKLLVCTSVELAPPFNRYQGKLYLWGVFRGPKPPLI